jgi:hypothetical protein
MEVLLVVRARVILAPIGAVALMITVMRFEGG